MKRDEIPSIKYVKRQAKQLRKDLNIPHHEALERMARLFGHKNWQSLKDELRLQADESFGNKAVKEKVIPDNIGNR